MSDALQPPWTAVFQASMSITNSWSLLRFMSIESVMPFNHLILCRPLLPSVFPNIRVFSNESALRIRWPKYWSFSFNISPSNEHPGLLSSRMDWLDLLAPGFTAESSDRFKSAQPTSFLLTGPNKPCSPSRSPMALLHDLSLSAQIHAILLVDTHTGPEALQVKPSF